MMIPTIKYTTGEIAIVYKQGLNKLNYFVVKSQYGDELCYCQSFDIAFKAVEQYCNRVQKLYKKLLLDYDKYLPKIEK